MNKKLNTLLPSFLSDLAKKQKERPDLIIAAWPRLIGEKMASMPRAESFN